MRGVFLFCGNGIRFGFRFSGAVDVIRHILQRINFLKLILNPVKLIAPSPPRMLSFSYLVSLSLSLCAPLPLSLCSLKSECVAVYVCRFRRERERGREGETDRQTESRWVQHETMKSRNTAGGITHVYRVLANYHLIRSPVDLSVRFSCLSPFVLFGHSTELAQF